MAQDQVAPIDDETIVSDDAASAVADLFEDILDVEAALRLALNGFAPADAASPDAIMQLAARFDSPEGEQLAKAGERLREAIAKDAADQITMSRQELVALLTALRSGKLVAGPIDR